MSKMKYFKHSTCRDEQKTIIERVYNFFHGDTDTLILHADPGIGKESCMVSQGLLAMEEGISDKLIFSIPTDSGKFNIVKELESTGYKNFVAVHSKNVLCKWMKDKEDPWIKEIKDEKCAFEICKIAKHRCPYLNHCDYLAQKEIIKESDVIICDYNYIISPFIRERSGFDDIIDNNKTTLFLNECHKLPQRMESLYSITLSINTINKAIQELTEYGYSEEKYGVIKLKERLENEVSIRKTEFLKNIYDYSLKFAEDVISPIAIDSINMDGIHLEKIGDNIARDKFEKHIGVTSYTERIGHFFNKYNNSKKYAYNQIYFIKLKDDLETKYIGWEPIHTASQSRNIISKFHKSVLYSGTMIPNIFAGAVGLRSKKNNLSVNISERIDSPYLKNRKDIILKGDVFVSEIKHDEDTINRIKDNINIILKKLSPPTAVVCTNSWFDILNLNSYNMYKEPDSQDKVQEWLKTSHEHEHIYFSPYGRVSQSVDMPFLKSIFFIGFPFRSFNKITKKRSDSLARSFKNQGTNAKHKAIYFTFIVPTYEAIVQSAMRGLRNENSKLTVVYYDKRFADYKKQLNSKNLSVYDDLDSMA